MKKIRTLMKRSVKLAVMTAVCTLFLSVTAFAATEEQEKGPGVTGTEAATEEADASVEHGTSLGLFTTTGYCTCNKCSGGSGLTYSGTVPKAKHTISADLSVLPIGTKVRIGSIIYTVEDMGSGVNGNMIDIYYDTHDEAWAHGTKYNVEAFLIETPEEETKTAEESHTSKASDTDTSGEKGPGVK